MMHLKQLSQENYGGNKGKFSVPLFCRLALVAAVLQKLHVILWILAMIRCRIRHCVQYNVVCSVYIHFQIKITWKSQNLNKKKFNLGNLILKKA